jgi:hypothetical protein
LAEEYGLHFLETSAMADVNVEAAFVGLAKQVRSRLQAEGAKGPGNSPVAQGREGGSGLRFLPASADSYVPSCCYGGGDSKKKSKQSSPKEESTATLSSGGGRSPIKPN